MGVGGGAQALEGLSGKEEGLVFSDRIWLAVGGLGFSVVGELARGAGFGGGLGDALGVDLVVIDEPAAVSQARGGLYGVLDSMGCEGTEGPCAGKRGTLCLLGCH
jgi:hypothetical protein